MKLAQDFAAWLSEWSWRDTQVLVILAGLSLITLVSRSVFFFSDRDWKIPAWAEKGLNFAPIAALAAVIAPELVMKQGELIRTLADARIYGAAAGIAYYFWRKGVLGTIVTGLAVYLPLRLIWAW
jgi:branched-subunit amino acid transport protein